MQCSVVYAKLKTPYSATYEKLARNKWDSVSTFFYKEGTYVNYNDMFIPIN